MFHPIEAVYWFRERGNRPGRTENACDLFAVRGTNGLGPSDAHPWLVPPADQAPDRPEVDVLVIVTTHRRSQPCAAVIESLQACLARQPERRALVAVLEDTSDEDYRAVYHCARQAFGSRLLWLASLRHLGKVEYWRTYQTALHIARVVDAPHVLFLQDDVEFEGTIIDSVTDLHARLPSGPNVLYLFSSEDDEPEGRWIRFRRENVETLPLRRTQWFDLQAFCANREALRLLDYRMVPVHPNRWRRKPQLSSGVGKQLTRRLYGRAGVYQCVPPLVFHGGQTSLMNPAARTQRALDNRHLRPAASGTF